MLQRLFKRKNATEAFWSWFKKKADVYYHFEQDQDILFPKLKAALKKVHPDLVFEFSQILEDGSREFIISADGIKSIFPVVADLVGQAPTLNKWKIVAFRQPRNHVTHIYYQNIAISLDDVFFRYSKDSGLIGLELNIRGFYESPEWTASVFLLLDSVLGEYNTEMSLSYIDKKQLVESEITTLFPIRLLPEILRDYQSEFNN